MRTNTIFQLSLVHTLISQVQNFNCSSKFRYLNVNKGFDKKNYNTTNNIKHVFVVIGTDVLFGVNT